MLNCDHYNQNRDVPEYESSDASEYDSTARVFAEDAGRWKMEASEIEVGVWYRAKDKRKPARFVLYISPDRTEVQIDGDEVRIGQHYPTKSMAAFLNWCGGMAAVDVDGQLIGNGQLPEAH